MRIAICDDDTQELLQINQLMNEYLNHGNAVDPIEVQSYESSLELLAQIEDGKHFDIFLLDVIMPTINGIELAAEIRRIDQVSKIIFLTSSPEFAVESYSVDAFHYLLKPIQGDKFHSVLEKACNEISISLNQFIIVKTQTNLSRILLHELMYIEVIRRTIYFYLSNGTVVESSNSLSQIEASLLTNSCFVKPHRSFIVNLDFVKTLSNSSLSMTNSQSVPVSRNVLKEVKQAYINHSFR